MIAKWIKKTKVMWFYYLVFCLMLSLGGLGVIGCNGKLILCCPVETSPKLGLDPMFLESKYAVICKCDGSAFAHLSYGVPFAAFTVKDGKIDQIKDHASGMRDRFKIEARYPADHPTKAGQIMSSYPKANSDALEPKTGFFKNPPGGLMVDVPEDAEIVLITQSKSQLCPILKKKIKIFVIQENETKPYSLCAPLYQDDPGSLSWRIPLVADFEPRIVIEEVENTNPFAVTVHFCYKSINLSEKNLAPANKTSAWKGMSPVDPWMITIPDPVEEARIKNIIDDPAHPERDKYLNMCITVYVRCNC